MASLTSEHNAREKIITRTTSRLSRKTCRSKEIQNEIKNPESEDAKTQTNGEKVHSLTKNRDDIIGHLTQENDELRKENESLKRKLRELGMKECGNIDHSGGAQVVIGQRKHRKDSNTNRTELKSVEKREKTTETTEDTVTDMTEEKIAMAIKEAYREERFQQQERKHRACNIIVHGMTERADTADGTLVKGLFDAIQVKHSPKSVIRLGKTKNKTPRPLKIEMKNVTQKKELMKALPMLKDIGANYSRLSITDDHTKKDREILRFWVSEARKRTSNETGNAKWKVRGSPLTKLRLIKIDQKHTNQQNTKSKENNDRISYKAETTKPQQRQRKPTKANEEHFIEANQGLRS